MLALSELTQRRFLTFLLRGDNMTAEQFIKDFWGAIGAFIGAIIWLIRLEGKVKQVERTQSIEGVRLVEAMDKMSATQEKMSETINEMRTTLAGVVGYEKGAHEARKRAR